MGLEGVEERGFRLFFQAVERDIGEERGNYTSYKVANLG